MLHKEVEIMLRTQIVDQAETEKNESMHTGRFHRNEKFDVLQFDEVLEGIGNIRNMVTVQKEKVTIKRSGAVSMHQKFQINHITENIYHHHHGTLHLETFTDSIHYEPLDETGDGQLHMLYHVKLNGQDTRKHELMLIFKEEHSQ